MKVTRVTDKQWDLVADANKMHYVLNLELYERLSKKYAFILYSVRGSAELIKVSRGTRPGVYADFYNTNQARLTLLER